ncbi:unnamed protein product [Cyprideis torosa]|uniref:Uncharacterized protein n=1 Tax=Cyprideis torosa TaxID=163714 RepID=A0A7R8WJT6_9CRUS|nr:unnamed protein product [Cyprideis torosa]CAG0902391.1 unnamed protein product [Cyprideis torosa]
MQLLRDPSNKLPKIRHSHGGHRRRSVGKNHHHHHQSKAVQNATPLENLTFRYNNRVPSTDGVMEGSKDDQLTEVHFARIIKSRSATGQTQVLPVPLPSGGTQVHQMTTNVSTSTTSSNVTSSSSPCFTTNEMSFVFIMTLLMCLGGLLGGLALYQGYCKKRSKQNDSSSGRVPESNTILSFVDIERLGTTPEEVLHNIGPPRNASYCNAGYIAPISGQRNPAFDGRRPVVRSASAYYNSRDPKRHISAKLSRQLSLSHENLSSSTLLPGT